MSKHAVNDEQMAAAGLGPEEIAALEEEDAAGAEDAAVEESKTASDAATDGDGATAKADSEVIPQVTEDKPAGVVADPPAETAKQDKTDTAEVEKKVDIAATDKNTEEAAATDTTVADAAAATTETKTDDAGTDKAVKDESAVPAPQVDSFRAQLAARGIPEDYEDQLKATNDSIEALDKSLADGDIDYAKHAKANRELTTKLSDLTAIKREAEFVTGNNKVIADQHWDWEVERFTEEHEEFKDPVVYGALRGALEGLYTVDENSGKSYRWFLREAASKVREAFNMDKPAAPVGEGTKDEEADRAAAIQQQHKDKPQGAPPKTLGGVSEAATEEEATDEFTQLDKLEGMELESELAKLPRAKVDQYLDSRSFHQ